MEKKVVERNDNTTIQENNEIQEVGKTDKCMGEGSKRLQKRLKQNTKK